MRERDGKDLKAKIKFMENLDLSGKDPLEREARSKIGTRKLDAFCRTP